MSIRRMGTRTGLLGVALVACAMAGAPAHAVLFSFSCDSSINAADCAGNEGGTLDLTSVLDGTSYLYTLQVNNVSISAGVTGFGFDFDPDFEATDLVAASLSVIREDGTDISSRWQISAGTQSVSNGTSYDGINLSFIDFDGADTGGPGGINASAIFNTDTIDATILFRLTENLVAEGGLLRLQRTGTGGGSLKLVGSTTTDVPEPGSLALLGAGLLGLGLMRRRRTA